ncbi:CRISPR-associated protein Cas2 [Bibersteinia trehalosi Y31]|uniref:CRISPR-associated endoribonuclease Cas2 n=1 Tax=Bibersteinia trehalosi Y31 TaxID=1261658 RepID=A0A179D0S7_BIBTR|nr:CRISPR-associated endonuclease Cas2 [Bibersteinia trehalosi]OAQ15398.1 CRISPR-associated protein Cas2 [Bibersteinia trehalosi Y31]
MQYLIGYDITNPKRLIKVHKRMTKYATPLQYSIFLLEGTNKLLQECLNDVLTLLDKKQDDLRVYPLSSGTKQWQVGKAILPEGIIWTALPMMN